MQIPTTWDERMIEAGLMSGDKSYAGTADRYFVLLKAAICNFSSEHLSIILRAAITRKLMKQWAVNLRRHPETESECEMNELWTREVF